MKLWQKKRKEKQSSYSLVEISKGLILLAVVIIVINIVISATSIINIQRQNFEVVQNSADLFLKETANNLQANQHFILWTVLRELLIEELEETDNDYEQYIAKESLQMRVGNHQYSTGYEYQYFVYLPEQELFFNASQLTLPYADYLGIKSFVIDQAVRGQGQIFSWKFAEINGKTYLYNLLTYNSRTVCAFVSIDDLVSPLADMDLGKQGYCLVSDLNGKTLFSTESRTAHTLRFNLFYSRHLFSGEDYHLPYNILLYSDNFHNYGRLFLFQLFVIITSTFVCIILAAFIVNMYRKVIKPISVFTANLEKVNTESDLIDLQSSRVRELEQTNLQFQNLIRQIERLKINIYETELEKKRFQVTFLQHQIRPHFYLNCLTTIGSMAQLKDYRDIESMVLFTSRYLRYLFQADKDFIRLEYELDHIQAYLDIQHLRLEAPISYTCRADEELKNALLPPLLLITFIENSVKHAQTADETLEITLSAKKEEINGETYLRIDIVDSGQGFPKELLDRLAHPEDYIQEDGPNVGIRNSIQRLILLYGARHQIRIFNGDTGGAHVLLRIPYQVQEMNENEGTARR